MDAEPEDAVLARGAAGGDLAAWGRLCHRHAPMLAGYLGGRLRRPDVVERLVGQAVLSGWRNLGEAGNPGAFAGWWRRVAGQLATAWARESPHEPLEGPLPAERLPTDPDRRRRLIGLDAAIAGLDEADRRFIELSDRGGIGPASAARILDIGGDPQAHHERIVAQLAARLAGSAATA